MTETVRFYRTKETFGGFSNFSKHRVTLDGVEWPTAEHCFQALKFVRQADREAVLNASSPRDAARIGRDRNRPIRPDWDEVRVDQMRRVLRAKFEQHPELEALLLSTGDAAIVEHSPKDRFWGDGGDGTGLNMLGRLLMELRDDLAKETPKGMAQNPQ